MANGMQKLIVDQTDIIENRLKSKMSENSRVILESMKLILIVLGEDHPKTSTMYQWFKPLVWVLLAIALALITTAATGHIQVNVIP